jgi:hypothetical protein
MTAEMRHIIFDRSEVIAAIEALLKRRAQRGHIIGMDIVPGPALRADIRLRVDRKGQEKRLQIDRHELGAALVAFCGASRIPLARRAEKRLVILGGDLALMASLDVPLASIEALQQMLLKPFYTEGASPAAANTVCEKLKRFTASNQKEGSHDGQQP